MLNFPENDWPGDRGSFLREADRHDRFKEHRRVNSFNNFGELANDDDESEELVPLNTTTKLSNKHRRYGSLQMKCATTIHPRTIAIHKIKQSDTLAGIAVKYDISVEELKRTNCLVSDWDLWKRKELQIPVSLDKDISFNSSILDKKQHTREENRDRNNQDVNSRNLDSDFFHTRISIPTNQNPSSYSMPGSDSNFDPVLVGIESGNADTLWAQDLTGRSLSTPEIKAPEGATNVSEDANVVDFFAKFDRKTAQAKNSASAVIKRIEKNHAWN